MKKVKKTYRFILIVVGILILLPTTGYVFLQSKRIQNSIIQKITSELSEKIKAQIRIESASVNLFNRAKLNNVYIEDLNRDTLFFAEEVRIGLRKFSQKRRVIEFSRVEIDRSKFYFRIDTAGVINLQFIIDELKNNQGGKSSREKLSFNIKNIDVTQSIFSLKNDRSGQIKKGIDFSDIWLEPLNMKIDNLHLQHDTVHFEVDDMYFKEKSGFVLEKMVTDLSLSKRHMDYTNMVIETKDSKITTKKTHLNFSNYNDFKIANIYDSVKLDIVCSPSRISLYDLAYFAQAIPWIDEQVILAGDFKGKLSNLKGKNLDINYGSHTRLQGNFDINGLPVIGNTFVFFDINRLITSVDDIQIITQQFYDPEYILNKTFRNIGQIEYAGKFTGFFDDFVTYGKFNTALGNVSTDLLLRPAGQQNIEYSGRLITENFEIGKLLAVDKNVLNRISGDVNINGKSSQEFKVDADIEGTIKKLDLNKYSYKNIRISGRLLENFFDGFFKVKDPNLDLEFAGKIDFNDELAAFNFTANVAKANLFTLNLDRSDSLSYTSFMLRAEGTGKNLDELNGNLELYNSFFSKTNKQLKLADFNLEAMNDPDSSHLSLSSDILDAEVYGKYELKLLAKSLKSFIHYYIPSLFPEEKDPFEIEQNKFEFNATLKDTREFTAFFIPHLDIAEETHVQGNFDPLNKLISLHLESPSLAYKNYNMEDLIVNVFTNEAGLSIESGSKTFFLNENIQLDNYTINLEGINDTIRFATQWHNWDSTVYRGKIKALCTLHPVPGRVWPSLNIIVPPSQIVMSDSVWNIAQSHVLIDSNRIVVNDFNIKRNQQHFSVNGLLSGNANDKLTVAFNNFRTENLNALIQNNKIQTRGKMNGHCEIFDIYQNFSFNSDLTIDELFVNGESIGHTLIKAYYNADQKLINIDAAANKGNIKTIALTGDYTPNNKNLDFNIELNKLRLNTFNPYLSNIFSNLKGMASGKIELTGSLDKPVTNGKIELNKSSLEVNYLKTKYSFSDQVQVKNNIIHFEEIDVFDAKGNKTIANGSISNNFLKDFEFNLHFDAENFLFLNTTYTDNNDFYGTAYASGRVDITGPVKNLVFDIRASTNQGTRFHIPLTSIEEVEEFNFVRFKSPVVSLEEEEVKPNEYKVNLSSVRLNFDLDVTPDAEAQIIFDSKMGDIIRGRGYGNLRMEINTLGKFNMYGDYNITEGDYLFTLQNIINKKFRIEEGSYISWNGDPMDANLNLKASYATKSSLTNLFPVEAENSSTRDESFYTKRIPVECQLFLTERLVNPQINFGIYLPTADPDTKIQVERVINTEEELSKHFLSLLVINSFMIDPNKIPSSEESNGGYASNPNPLGVTTSELFSNQISHWLSQMSNDIDIGVNYRPGDNLTNKELELALSTKILNDRVSINGNLDVGGKPTQASSMTNTKNIVGDFNVDFKINKNVHLKAFNKSNDNLKYYSDYTQGIGIFYREEFDTLDELLLKYLAKMGIKNKEQSEN